MLKFLQGLGIVPIVFIVLGAQCAELKKGGVYWGR